MRELYYSRHGITVDLENGIRSRPDTELSDLGQEQAQSAGRTLLARFVVPELVICSALPRARQSAEEIARIVGYDPSNIIQDELLNERECGIAIGMKNEIIKSQYPDGFDTVPGAESTESLQERAARTAEFFETFDQDVILAVGHGTIGRAIARHYSRRPYTEEFDRSKRSQINLDNGQIMRLTPGPIELFPVENGSPS